MNTTIPPPEFRAPLPGGPATTGVPATVPHPPPPLLSLTVGSLLIGTVVGQEEPGHFLVRTKQGTIPLTTRAPLEIGSQVTLQVRTRGTQLHVTITQIDGQPAHLRPNQPPIPLATNPPPTSDARIDSQPPPRQTDRVSLTPGLAARLTSTHDPSSGARPSLPVGTLEVTARVAQLLAQDPPRSGLVVASPEGGQLRIQTNLGTFGLTTESTIEPGTSVRILVRSTGPPLLIALETAATNRPHDAVVQRPAAPGFSAGAASGQPALTAAGAGPGPTDVLALGQRLRATVQAPAAGSSSAPIPSNSPGPVPAAQLPIGASLDIRIRPASGPQPPASAVHTPITPQVSVQGQIQGVGQGSIPSPVSSSIVALAASLAKPGTGNAAPVQPQTTGVVAGTSAQGRPLLQTPVGLLAIQVRAPLPIGAQFTIELLSPHQSPLTIGARPEPIPLTQTWPYLEEALQLLPENAAPATTAGGTASAAAPGQIPRPGPNLTSSVLFFLSALSGGNAGTWLQGLLTSRGRESIEGQGRGDLLTRLMQDFTQLGRLTDVAGPDWRFVPIPLYDGNQLHQLRLFLRQHRKPPDDERDDRAEATRFIVEVRLSQLGDLQLDGLIKQKRFDLMLRTRQALPPSMRQRITEIFGSANSAAGYLGNVGFQASEDWVPMPLANDAEGSRSLVI